ncbi:MAG: PQQ-binding-like beta-propeller repeat protein [Deltaproteobacteria bacterium]|nr:PQQ-binding-like beta-propeller repeat protein [Deltaproteobacteria bacterium]
MVRILTGDSWKLNPDYLQSLKLVAGRAPRFSTASILDALGIEVDGVNITQGQSEAAIFQVVDELAAIVLRMCRDPSGGGQVSLGEGATELVLGRRGARASLCLVSLARPARVLAGELEVDLSALAQATASCAQGLLSDLAGINDALAKASFSRRLAQRTELLRRAAQLSGRKRARKPDRTQLAPEPVAPSGREGPGLGFALFDEEGRVDAYRKGGELYSLLGPGEVFLRDARGGTLAAVKGAPFLLLTDLARAAADLLQAHEKKAQAWEGALAPGKPKLRLDLADELLVAEGHCVPCRPLELARAFLQAALDFGGAIVARNPGQSKNPYLSSLVETARERLDHLREVEGGDVFADSAAAPRAGSVHGSGAPLASAGNTLKRLRYRVAWSGADTGPKTRAARIEDGTLVVLGGRRASFVDALSGEVLARRTGDGLVWGDDGVLISDRARLLGVGWRGAPVFLRDLPGHDHPPLTASGGVIQAGEVRQRATVCVLEGSVLAALLSASGRALWHFHAPQAVRIAAAALKDRIWAAADNGFLYALEAKMGQVVFRVRAGCAFEGSLALGGGLVASLGRQDGALCLAAVDAASGRPRMLRPLAARSCGTPLPFRRRLIVGALVDGESQVIAIGFDSREAFRTRLAASGGVPVVAALGGRLYATLRDGSVTCLGPDGEVVWKAERCGLELDRALPPVLRRGVLIAAGDPLRALDPKTGTLLCELPPTHGLSAFAVGPKLDVHVVDDDGVAACYQLATHLSLVSG